MKTLIKWPGGKSREYKLIKEIIPKYERYFEPFFGGGAVFFKETPSQAFVNDISSDLIDFYLLVQPNPKQLEFQSILYEYVNLWEETSDIVSGATTKLLEVYHSATPINKIISLIDALVYELEKVTPQSCYVDINNLSRQLEENLISKTQRMEKLEKENGGLSEEDKNKNLETAIRSGLYMHFRDLMNHPDKFNLLHSKRIANYYFVREFCYGSMFRYNSSGEFNIPYGGIAYNTKDFRQKVDTLFSPEVQDLMNSTKFFNLDFEEFLEQYNFSSNDFVFLDPPYDTDFSNYDKNEFGRVEQTRLASILRDCNAKFILIIKNTEFILSLYSETDKFNVSSFDKTYSYNIRGRNLRETQHLVITNF
ncbi:DNA adenine methylase [bacterium]|nr:DNA adenine methylase [bacterium]